MRGMNAPTKPNHEGQIVRFKSPHAEVILYDIAKVNPKHGGLEWWALNDPTEDQINIAEGIQHDNERNPRGADQGID